MGRQLIRDGGQEMQKVDKKPSPKRGVVREAARTQTCPTLNTALRRLQAGRYRTQAGTEPGPELRCCTHGPLREGAMAARGRGCLGNGGGVLEGLLSLFSSPLFSPYFSSPFLFSSLPPSLSIPSVTPPRSIAPLSSVPPRSTHCRPALRD